jgi:hypothetical protein
MGAVRLAFKALTIIEDEEAGDTHVALGKSAARRAGPCMFPDNPCYPARSAALAQCELGGRCLAVRLRFPVIWQPGRW